MPATEVVVKLTLLSLGFPLFTFGCAVGTTSEDAGTTQTTDAAAKDSGKKTLRSRQPASRRLRHLERRFERSAHRLHVLRRVDQGALRAMLPQKCPGGYNTYCRHSVRCALACRPGPCASACSTSWRALREPASSTTGDACDTCVNGAAHPGQRRLLQRRRRLLPERRRLHDAVSRRMHSADAEQVKKQGE